MLDAAIIDAMDHALAFRPPAIFQEVVDVRGRVADFLASSRRQLAAASRELDAWIKEGQQVRVSLRSAVPQLAPEPEILVALSGFIRAVERRVADDERIFARLEKSCSRQLRDAHMISPQVEEAVREITTGTLRLFAKEASERAEFGLFLRALRAELDPEAQGGPVFDDADDLKRYLESAVS